MIIKKILPMLAAIVSAMCLMAGAVSFSDVEGHWAYEQIMEYAEKGIVNGDTEGTFRPDDTVTRAEFCKIMLNSFGVSAYGSNTASFSDVSADDWYYAYVESASMYLTGYEDGTFRPNEPAKREDVTAAIVRLMGYPASFTANEGYAATAFTDGASISKELLPLVSSACEKGLVNGMPNGTFMPSAGITRAETVTLISRAVNKYTEDIFSWDEAMEMINSVFELEEDDKNVMMTVNGFGTTVSEYRYYYLVYCDTFNYYFGEDWNQNQELVAMFEEYFNNDILLPGIIYSLVVNDDVKISMEDINISVFSNLAAYYDSYGDNLPAYLEQVHVTPSYFLKNCLYAGFLNELKNNTYGVGGYMFEETAQAFKEDYVRAKHVLVMIDENTAKEEAFAVAQEVLTKANAGEDFDTLIANYNEDPGMVSNPDGYVFTYGQMVEPFEEAAFALKDGEISGIVETDYGYHIIKRLPLDDEAIATSSAYASMTDVLFKEELNAYYGSETVELSENFNQLVLPIYEEAGYSMSQQESTKEIDVESASAEEIIQAINAIKAPEFMYGVIPVEITDADALKMFTGLDSADKIEQAAVCESMMGSQAYSLVVVKVKDAADAKSVAEEMKAGIDPAKWICVEADDIKVSGKGNTVVFIMVDSQFKESITAAGVTEAFKTVCGTELDFEF